MVKHLVVFKMKAEDAVKNTLALADKFREISAAIPECLQCETGLNVSTAEKQFYELGLAQTFESSEAMQRYLQHPLHLAVREFVFQVIDHRIVVDFEL